MRFLGTLFFLGFLISLQEDTQKELERFLQEVEKLKEENRWDEALKLLESLKEKFPSCSERIAQKSAHIMKLRNQALKTSKAILREAEKLFSQKRYLDALLKLRIAKRLYQGLKDLDKLSEKIKKELFYKEMVKIPESYCIVGSNDQDDEKPQHRIKLKEFYIDKFEVTNQEYAIFVKVTGHPPPRFWEDGKIPVGKEKHPVVGITKSDAEAFAKWIGKRLPTAWEWEKAARGSDGRIYPWGNEFPKEKILCNSLEYAKGSSMPIGSFEAGKSPYGVYDLAGNVWEWTASSVTTEGKEFVILKGGSFMTPRQSVRASNILLEDPQARLHDVGFRCVCEKLQ
jgi:formylglycine-generating enzyme required for sulfatase activity